MISQIVAGTALAVFARTAENSAETYYNYTTFSHRLNRNPGYDPGIVVFIEEIKLEELPAV